MRGECPLLRHAVAGTANGHRSRVNLVRLASLLALVGAWLYGLGPGEVSPLVLPEMQAVWSEFISLIFSAETYRHIRVTFFEVFVAILISGTTGLLVGFWAARSALRSQVIEPLLAWAYLAPSILFYPLILLWFGFGVSSKIAYAVGNAFFVVAYNCLRGFARVDEAYVRVGQAFGASKFQLDWGIKFRAALPLAAAGMKLGAALVMISVIVTEMLASTAGLGHLISRYATSFFTARTYATILLVLVMVGLFHAVVGWILREDRFRIG